ncbi:MAG: transglycosylase domain-containing protein, partial [Pyramidobacter sp.]|nr:transglycosylase domain-containing protein [Pyramidobacter sp.]
MKHRKFTLWLGGLLLGAAGAFALLFRSGESMGDLAPIESRLSAWPRSTAVRDRKGALLSVTLSEDGEFCLPVLLSDMGRWMPLAVVEVEDRRFWSHGGVDWISLTRAAFGNVFSRKGRTGASTITSQLIRICWPAERNVRTKLREFAQARALEKRHSKEELLTTYLNIIPLGSNLRGVEAASLAWFGRSARDLTIAQAALLAVMVKGPTAYRPDLHPKAALARRNWAISLMERRGRISAEQARLARAEPLPVSRRALPAEEWVFCTKAASLTPERDITSTLDRAMQKTLRGALLDALADFDSSVTASGVLIENDTGAVRAYIPNARRGQKGAPAEWVDCASALRSPGSALKPFAYALAFEDGTLSPASLMADTPLTLSGRAPRNFDRLYRGPVSAANALVDSLNVPAVRILRREGGERLLQKLRLLGFSSLTQSAVHYGDSLVLGGCEVSPLQLATAAT